jgi:EAL domain-containing protein (putative c-di-GMP-specific phosphodiesterase class I)
VVAAQGVDCVQGYEVGRPVSLSNNEIVTVAREPKPMLR